MRARDLLISHARPSRLAAVAPNGRPIGRNQSLVIQLLGEKDAALLLFNGAAGRRRRTELISAGEMDNPRGTVVYHIEMLNLLEAQEAKIVRRGALLRAWLQAPDLHSPTSPH